MGRNPTIVALGLVCAWSWMQTIYGEYLIGMGSYDMTGPAADVNMMGYANFEQNTAGIHFRLRARTFIVAENLQGPRFVFVNLDAGMASQLLTIKVLERLNLRFGNLYTEENVAISGIHTHAGPGGYLQYMVYSVTSLGFVKQSFDAIANAIEQSIIQAHSNLKPGSIFMNIGDVKEAGINRSASAYKYPDEILSTMIISDRQFRTAVELLGSASEELTGKIDYRHVYLNFTDIEVELDSNKVVKTCPAALGPGFAAGTTDGPGAFGFQQGDTEINPFWKTTRDLLKKPSQYQVDCQKPKQVLLSTGEMFDPYPWAPAILPIQMLRLGKLIILSVPGEFTTMAGRRLREAVKETLISSSNREFNDETHVVIAGLTNTYSQYIATFEEYQHQRYEAASTLYGPHTLSAYIQEFKKLAQAMGKGEKIIGKGPLPPDLSSVQLSLLLGPFGDSTPDGIKFGDIKEDIAFPARDYFTKGDRPSATFWSANPRNDLLTEGTFAAVEMLQGERWIATYDDDDLSLFFKWKVDNSSLHGLATIEWEIPNDAISGVYRLKHFGASKITIASPIKYFTGASSAFAVQ
ncbi:neutral ceramidase 2-like [Gastrolobium bilobum]|uniref:neutral ceramidase 2-like n=1 Tax=Gastrolobium bilobum TaxID=150636 RepID=UPI002AB31919|nr:neutral ceramidase 2-like [Gastrolobium bilobum]